MDQVALSNSLRIHKVQRSNFHITPRENSLDDTPQLF